MANGKGIWRSITSGWPSRATFICLIEQTKEQEIDFIRVVIMSVSGDLRRSLAAFGGLLGRPRRRRRRRQRRADLLTATTRATILGLCLPNWQRRRRMRILAGHSTSGSRLISKSHSGRMMMIIISMMILAPTRSGLTFGAFQGPVAGRSQVKWPNKRHYLDIQTSQQGPMILDIRILQTRS